MKNYFLYHIRGFELAYTSELKDFKFEVTIQLIYNGSFFRHSLTLDPISKMGFGLIDEI